MSKYLFADRAQGQATSAPDASATSITLNDSNDTVEFTENGSPSASNPQPCLLTDQPYGTEPSKVETVLVTDITDDVFTITRDADGKGAQDFSAGSCYIGCYSTSFLLQNMVQRDGDSVKNLGADVFNNAASGTFDRNNGELQKCSLTASGVVITFTNVPEGGMCRAAITDADVYAPDISAMAGLWREGVEPTFGKITIISAVNDNGTVRYIAGGSWSA